MIVNTRPSASWTTVPTGNAGGEALGAIGFALAFEDEGPSFLASFGELDLAARFSLAEYMMPP